MLKVIGKQKVALNYMPVLIGGFKESLRQMSTTKKMQEGSKVPYKAEFYATMKIFGIHPLSQ